MASAIIGGMIAKGWSSANITVSEPNELSCTKLRLQFPGIKTATDNSKAVAASSLVILAVKPQIMSIVCKDIKAAVMEHSPAVISIAAGVTIAGMSSILGSNTAIIRCMPNTPALVNEGATGLYAPKTTVSQAQRDAADAVMSSVSKKLYWVESEQLLDVVTGVSGSGPAYFLLLIECITDAGVKLGLPLDIAQGLAVQTCLGAGKMASESDVDAKELRRRVTSPNGTTEAAIKSAEASGMRDMWMKAVSAATSRADELGSAKL